MPKCHRFLDLNSGGGAITTIPQGSVFANSKLISVDGSFGTSHPPCPFVPIHCMGAWITILGSPNVFINNISVTRENDVDTCGHVRVAGSPDVFVN